MHAIGDVTQRTFGLVTQAFGSRLTHDPFGMTGVPVAQFVVVGYALVRVGSDACRAFLALPEMIVHDVIRQLRAVETVVREGIDTVRREQHIFDGRHLAARAQPVTVREPVVAQVEKLHAIVCGQIGGAVMDSDVIYRLLLRHIFVVQVADILDAVSVHQVDAACLVGDDQGLGHLVVTDTSDVRAVQTRLAVIYCELLRLLIDAEEAAVRYCIHFVGRHRNLRDVVVCEVRSPFSCDAGEAQQQTQNAICESFNHGSP